MSTPSLPQIEMLIAYRLFKRGPGGEESIGYFLSQEVADENLEEYVQRHGEHNRDYLHIEEINIKA